MGTVSYNNRKVRVVSAFIASIYIVFHGIPVDLIKAFSSPGFYIAAAVSFAVSLLLVTVVHHSTLWLDKRCPWRERPFERAALQLIFGIVVPALVDLLLISVYFEALDESMVENGFLLIDFPVIVCLIIFFNLYYLIHYLILTEAVPVNESVELQEIHDASLAIHYNGQHVYFQVANDILFFHRQGKLVKGMTIHGNKYPINESISSLEKRYSSDGFVRINRATIVNYKMVNGYIAGSKRDTVHVIIKPEYATIAKDPDKEIYLVTKEFLNPFKAGLEQFSP